MQTQSSTKTNAGEQRQQYISVELRQWIVAQAQAGVAPEAVLEAMKSSGWQEDVAIKALEETLRGHLTEQAAQAARRSPTPRAAARAGARRRRSSDSPSKIRILDRDVTVLTNMKHPRVIVLGGFMRDQECDQIDRAGRPAHGALRDGGQPHRRQRGQRRAHQPRHVLRAWRDGRDRPRRAAHRRAAQLAGHNGEGLQVLHYKPGAEYKPHYDYFDPVHPGSASILKRGGQRVGTLLMYLNTPKKGGGTIVPRRRPGSGAHQGQRLLLQLRPRPRRHQEPARRRAGDRGREVGRDEVAARARIHLSLPG